MKYCEHCGAEMLDDAVLCVKCGCEVTDQGVKPQVAKTKVSNPSKAPVILGIVGIIFAWLIAIVGHITSIIGIVLGVQEYRKTGDVKGLRLSIIGEACAIISSILGALMVTGL